MLLSEIAINHHVEGSTIKRHWIASDVDARVLSIFEGADETLCSKVIARQLIANSAQD